MQVSLPFLWEYATVHMIRRPASTKKYLVNATHTAFQTGRADRACER
jgi:hypothetical protein